MNLLKRLYGFRRTSRIEVDPRAVLFKDIELYAQWCDASARSTTNMDWPMYRISMSLVNANATTVIRLGF